MHNFRRINQELSRTSTRRQKIAHMMYPATLFLAPLNVEQLRKVQEQLITSGPSVTLGTTTRYAKK